MALLILLGMGGASLTLMSELALLILEEEEFRVGFPIADPPSCEPLNTDVRSDIRDDIIEGFLGGRGGTLGDTSIDSSPPVESTL